MTPEQSCKKIISIQSNEVRSGLLRALKDSFSINMNSGDFKSISAFNISKNYNFNAKLLHQFGICLTRKEILSFISSIGYSPSRINIGMATRSTNYYQLFKTKPLKVSYGAYIYTYGEIIALLSQSYKKLEKIIIDSFSVFNFTDENGLYVPSNKIIIEDVTDELYEYFHKDPNLIYKLPPRKFEELVATIFKRSGYNVELTPPIKDGGYDLIAIQNDKLTGPKKYLVECKRYEKKNKVGIGVVRGLYGVVQIEKATKGIITTTSSFTKDAKELAENFKYQIELIDFNRLRDWVASISK